MYLELPASSSVGEGARLVDESTSSTHHRGHRRTPAVQTPPASCSPAAPKRRTYTMVVFDGHEFLTEEKRLKEDRERTKYWKKWGPYVAERQWATGIARVPSRPLSSPSTPSTADSVQVREDYSADGDAWSRTSPPPPFSTAAAPVVDSCPQISRTIMPAREHSDGARTASLACRTLTGSRTLPLASGTNKSRSAFHLASEAIHL